jgi:hypothetical protein
MHKDIIGTIIRLDETESLLGVEPLDSSTNSSTISGKEGSTGGEGFDVDATDKTEGRSEHGEEDDID